MKKSLKKLRRGFTLIELLVVIAIIGILATIIIINVAAARNKANATKVLSEITSANQGAIACLAENGTANPPTPSNNAGGSVCTPVGAGLSMTWPILGTAATAYVGWAYAANAAVPSTGIYIWTATNSASAFTVTFSNTNTTKSGF